MTTLIKTQCPKCDVYFDLSTELTDLLHNPSTQMRCAHCQHSFVINEHLVVSADDHLFASKPLSTAAKNNDNSWLEVLLHSHNNQDHESNNNIIDKYLNDRYFDDSKNNAVSTVSQNVTLRNPYQPILSFSPLKNELSENYEETHSWKYEGAQRSIATLLWMAGCLVLVLSLFAQYVIFNLNTLLKNPEYSAHLTTVCAIAVCRLPSADLDAFAITDLSFETSEIKSDNKFMDVQAILENKSSNSQLFPSLKVSIYGSNSLLGEFIALPEDYLIGRQNQLVAGYGKPFMFTIPITASKVSEVIIEPIY